MRVVGGGSGLCFLFLGVSFLLLRYLSLSPYPFRTFTQFEVVGGLEEMERYLTDFNITFSPPPFPI